MQNKTSITIYIANSNIVSSTHILCGHRAVAEYFMNLKGWMSMDCKVEVYSDYTESQLKHLGMTSFNTIVYKQVNWEDTKEMHKKYLDLAFEFTVERHTTASGETYINFNENNGSNVVETIPYSKFVELGFSNENIDIYYSDYGNN